MRGKLINLYLPYLGAGIRVVECDDLMTRFVVEMNLNRFNKNIMGTHFGGSLYAMCDPFFMWILMENLGKDFIVWDKAATIRFKKPGTGTVRAVFEIPQTTIDAIKEEVPPIRKQDYVFHAEVLNEAGEVVAEVDKTVYVRYNPKK
jgi:acyl-coenzyme A thioesterase PaaI-like protein